VFYIPAWSDKEATGPKPYCVLYVYADLENKLHLPRIQLFPCRIKLSKFHSLKLGLIFVMTTQSSTYQYNGSIDTLWLNADPLLATPT